MVMTASESEFDKECDQMNYRVSMDLRVLAIVIVSAAALLVAGIMLSGQMTKGQLEVKNPSQTNFILADEAKPCPQCRRA
jgi:hypothetical protein